MPVIPVRVMVVDDHPIWRDAVARDLVEAGYDVTAVVGEAAQAIRVLMLSASGEQQDVLDTLTAGARGYLVKSAKPAEPLSRGSTRTPKYCNGNSLHRDHNGNNGDTQSCRATSPTGLIP